MEMKSNKSLEFESCAETSIEPIKQSDEICHADIVVDAVWLEVKNIQEFEASAEVELTDTVQPLEEICCQIEVGAESKNQANGWQGFAGI